MIVMAMKVQATRLVTTFMEADRAVPELVVVRRRSGNVFRHVRCTSGSGRYGA